MIVKIKKYWQWIVLTLGGLFLYLLGSKKQKDKATEATIEKDLYKKESEMQEMIRRKENRKIVEAEVRYKKAIASLEEKYDDEKSDLNREKDHIYKQMLAEVKDDPKKLNDFLSAIGIKEVKNETK